MESRGGSEVPVQFVLAEYILAIEDAEVRLERLTRQVAATAASWSMAPVIEAYQAMRGLAFLTAVTFVVEIGDVRRFDTAPQLMAYLGLVPSESSTGERVKRGNITKAGNMRARRVLIEGAWSYRFPARVYAERAVLQPLPGARTSDYEDTILLFRRRCPHHRTHPGVAAFVRQQCAHQHLAINSVGLDATLAPRDRNRGRVYDVALDPLGFEHTMNLEAV